MVAGAVSGTETFDPDERDWRLQGTIDAPLHERSVHLLHSHLRDPGVLAELEVAVPDDTVLTHDGQRLFAYAADRRTIEQARSAIEAVLKHDGVSATLALTHFSEELDEWVDPDAAPSAGAESPARADSSVTQTVVANAGRMVREELEQSMRIWAQELGLRCEILEEHPHLLRTQVAFTVTGPKRKVGEFADGLRAESQAMIRTERAVMLSPL
jgi:hypothetical protein